MSFSTTLSQWIIVFGVSAVIAFAHNGLVVNAAITNAAFLFPRTNTVSKGGTVAKTKQATSGRQQIINDTCQHYSTAFLGPYNKKIPKSKSARTASSVLFVGGLGWDNDDFLESLGKGSDEIKKANDDYNRLSKYGGGRRERLGRDDDDEDDVNSKNGPESDEISAASIPGAALSADQIERIKRQNDDETADGGEMFRKLLERAEQQKMKQPSVLQTPMPSQQSEIKSTSASGPALPDNFASLSVEQQAALFRELMFNQQDSNTNNPLPFAVQGGGGNDGGGVADTPQKPGRDGRRVGRNRDADAIVNTSDVYLAQLKIDSTSRNRARYSGDDEFANQVFGDPRIKEIKLHVNPYLEEQKKAERELYGGDTVDFLQELGRPMGPEKPEQVDVSYAGPKYKDRLRERRSGKTPPKSTTSENSFARNSSPTQFTFPGVVSAKTDETIVSSPPSFLASTQISAPPMQQPTTPVAVQSVSSPEYVDAIVTPPEPVAQNEDDFRRQLRTLEGLLLKHRGGPGFGLGRLQGLEMQRLISTADSVLAKLRREEPIMMNRGIDDSTADVGAVQREPAATFTSPPSPTSMLTRSFPGSEPSSAADATQRLNSMIQCVEGSIQMFKFSPPGLRESVLITVRAALLSALTTCNECMNDNSGMVNIPQASPSGRSEQQLEQMLGYLEGAIQMYKFSPVELQSSILISVRAALLSAVSTCNSIIADNEIMTYAGTTTMPRPVPPSIGSTPRYTEAEYVPTPAPPQATATTPAPLYKGNDENTQFLETVYNQLRAAQGMTGKMGLRDNLTSTEAQELADSITMMRSMLVEELDSGIPDNTDGSSATTGTTSLSSAPSTANLYQQMLAKARASKQE
jgi:hypothetical protein